MNNKLDEQYNRQRRHFIRNVMILSVFIIVCLIAFSAYTLAMLFEIRTQREIAISERNFADQERAKAEDTLSHSKSILLARTIDNANRLTQQGYANRAVALLASVYENIDFTRSDALLRRAQFRDAALTAMFPGQSQPYASLNLSGEVIATGFLKDGNTIAITQNAMYKIHTQTGMILHHVVAPENEELVLGNVFDRYAAAVTKSQRIMIFDAETGKSSVTEMTTRAYERRECFAVYVDEERGFAATAEFTLGRFEETPEDTFYTPLSTEDELSGKLIFVFIPFGKEELVFNENESQTIVYKTDHTFGGSGRVIQGSFNGRLYAFINQRLTIWVPDAAPDSTWLNGDITFLDLSRFNISASREENRINLVAETFDSRINGEERFEINAFYLENSGRIFLDGYGLSGDESANPINHRLIVYDYAVQKINANVQVMTDAPAQESWQLIRCHDDGSNPVNITAAYLVYNVQTYERSLKFFAVYQKGIGTVQTINLPNDFLSIRECYVVDASRLLVSGNVAGDASTLLVSKFINIKMQTLPAARTTFNFNGGTVLTGYRSGALQFNNINHSPYATAMEPETRLIERNELVKIAYDEERERVFGFIFTETGEPNEYGIYDVSDGKLLLSFPAMDKTEEMRINKDFTYIIAKRHENEFIDLDMDINYYYRMIDAVTGEELFRNESPFTRHASVKFGLTANPEAAWFFRGDMMRLEVINLRSGEILRAHDLADKLPHGVSSAGLEVCFDVNSDLIIFVGSDGFVFSLVTNTLLFYAHIQEAALDARTIYISNERHSIELSAEVIYAMLKQSSHTPPLHEEDADWLDIFKLEKQ